MVIVSVSAVHEKEKEIKRGIKEKKKRNGGIEAKSENTRRGPEREREKEKERERETKREREIMMHTQTHNN